MNDVDSVDQRSDCTFFQIIVSLFVHFFDIISLFAAEFEEPKIGISGKGLMTTVRT